MKVDPYNPDWSDIIGDKLPQLPLSKGPKPRSAKPPKQAEPEEPLKNEDFPAIERTHPLKLREFPAPENVDPEIWQDERTVPPAPARQDPDYELGWQGQASLSPQGGGSRNSRATAAPPPKEVHDAIVAAATKAGLDPKYALAVAERESSFNPNEGGTGSIRGLFQMTGGLRSKYGADGDANAQAAGFAAFTRDLKNDMAARMGRQPTDAETYMGHHFGGSRAARMLTSMDPNTRVEDVFTPRELAGNPHIVKAGTVGNLRDQTLGDMQRRMGRYAPQSAEPGMDPRLARADQVRTAEAQRMPTVAISPQNQPAFDAAVADMPQSGKVEDRRPEASDPDLRQQAEGDRVVDDFITKKPPAQRVDEGFAAFGTPLAREAGFDDVGKNLPKPKPGPIIIGPDGRHYGEPQVAQPSPYAAPGPTGVHQGAAAPNYNTQLAPLDEMAFRQWVKDKGVPFDPEAKTSDYDMRGYYQGIQQGDPRAVSSTNPNDNQLHYPDVWKTPSHKSFSADSQYADPNGPRWTADDKLVSPGGRVITNERAKDDPSKNELPDFSGFGQQGAP